ncbi:hypothetical protein GCM10023334_076710 [Nonomuraea thailandensis]
MPVEIRCTYGFLEVRGRIPLILGEPTGPVADALDRAMAGYAAGLRAIRPGNTAGQAPPRSPRNWAVPATSHASWGSTRSP